MFKANIGPTHIFILITSNIKIGTFLLDRNRGTDIMFIAKSTKYQRQFLYDMNRSLIKSNLNQGKKTKFKLLNSMHYSSVLPLQYPHKLVYETDGHSDIRPKIAKSHLWYHKTYKHIRNHKLKSYLHTKLSSYEYRRK